MSMTDKELDGLCPCPLADVDGVALACSVDDSGAVTDDVSGASVVAVAVDVILVDVVTMIDYRMENLSYLSISVEMLVDMVQ